MTPLLKVSALDAFYGDFQALFGIDFKLEQGEAVAVIGANGAGKSTLLKSLAGLVGNRRDAIQFAGQEIGDSKAARVVRLGLALVPEGRQLFPSLTVEENLSIGAYGGDRTSPWDLPSVYRTFPVLQERRHSSVTVLSGGQQQMVAIGRALLSRPKLLLLDEPSMGLAPLLVEEIFNAIINLRQQGKTIFLVEQNAQAALSIADRAYVIETGEVVLSGSGSELLENDRVRAAYLGM